MDFSNVPREFLKRIDRIIMGDEINDPKLIDPFDITALTKSLISCDEDAIYNIVGEYDPNKLLNLLMRYMGNNEICSAMDLAEEIKVHAYLCYEPYIEQIFYDRCAYWIIEGYKNKGLSAHVDWTNGEVSWR